MRPAVLTYVVAAAIVQAQAQAQAADSLGFDDQYSPFSDPLFARSNVELLLLRRADSGSCQSGYKSCSADGSTVACCPNGSNCTHDAAGNVACCPTSALCTGVISTATATATAAAGTSLSTITTTTTTSGVVISSSQTTVEATTTTDFSSAVQLPTSGVEGGGSTVTNSYYPFVYIPTSYANANLCLSAYSYCQSQSTACAASLAGSGVTVSNDGASGGITIQGAASTTLNPVSASSICSSLSQEACYGLASSKCGTATTTSGLTTTATFINHGPIQTACPGALYAAGAAGAFVGGLRVFL